MQKSQKQFQCASPFQRPLNLPPQDHHKVKSEQDYYQDEFEEPLNTAPLSYKQTVDEKFSVPYDSSTYEQIQTSTREMREALKQLSGKLDDKIHKYYGLMGEKHKPQLKNVEQLHQQLEAELMAAKKLIQSQQAQIREIFQVQQEMASSKRVQKQAERLRQYFQTKKNMLVIQKDTRFNRGQINKFGDYLARNLDVDKYYFRLNKIKQDFQYAMLKDKETYGLLIEKQAQLAEMNQKYNQIVQVHESYLRQAVQKKLLIEENEVLYNEHKRKKQLLNKYQQVKKNVKITDASFQSNIYSLFTEVQRLKRQQIKQSQKLQSVESDITKLQQMVEEQAKQSGEQTFKVINGHLAIRNIETLLKTKKEKLTNSGLFSRPQNKKQTQSLNSSLDLSSSTLLKPNFKIKPYLLQKERLHRSFSRQTKAKDSSEKKQTSVKLQLKKKRVLNWRRQHSKDSPNPTKKQFQNLPKINKITQDSSSYMKKNPQQEAQMVEEIPMQDVQRVYAGELPELST